MQTQITANGQTVIPDAIRRRFKLDELSRLEWIVEENSIRLIPVHSSDPVGAFRGKGQGGATQRLLQERHTDEVKL